MDWENLEALSGGSGVNDRVIRDDHGDDYADDDYYDTFQSEAAISWPPVVLTFCVILV